MKKMLMLATTAAMIEQFNKDNILLLEEMGYEVHVAGNFHEGNPISDEKLNAFKKWIEEHHGRWFHISSVRKPTSVLENLKAYKKIISLINEYHYDFIHCHTPIGSVLGRVAAHMTRTKVIYTAHGFHFYDGAPLKNWLIYYPVERFLSRWTDVLITINKEDYNRAKKTFYAKRTEYIPGVGVDLERFNVKNLDKKKKRNELGISEEDIMLLSVGELIPRKNHEIVIRALKKIGRNEIKYCICGKGDGYKRLQNVIGELGMERSVYLLGFRDDISEICQVADMYVFPSLQEGLPVALMEAIASKVPVVCSRIRGNVDLILGEDFLFHPNNVDEVAEKIVSILEQDCTGIVEESYERIYKFDLKVIRQSMREQYELLFAKSEK